MRRLALLGAVVLALAVVAAFALSTKPAWSQPAVAAGQVAAVTSVTRSCPPAAPGAGTTTHISMIAVPSQAASAKGSAAASTGAATLSAVPAAPASPAAANPAKKAAKKTSTKTASVNGSAPAAPVTVSEPGTATTVTAPSAGDAAGTALAATGQMAEGFEAEQATSAGMGLVSCSHPSPTCGSWVRERRTSSCT